MRDILYGLVLLVIYYLVSSILFTLLTLKRKNNELEDKRKYLLRFLSFMAVYLCYVIYITVLLLSTGYTAVMQIIEIAYVVIGLLWLLKRGSRISYIILRIYLYFNLLRTLYQLYLVFSNPQLSNGSPMYYIISAVTSILISVYLLYLLRKSETKNLGKKN